jgi:transposase
MKNGPLPEVIKRSNLETEEGGHVFRRKDVVEISELKREGLSVRAISRLTGYSRGTISKYLLTPTGRPVYGQRVSAVSKLEPFTPYLKDRLQAGVWNARVLPRELRERNYGGDIRFSRNG